MLGTSARSDSGVLRYKPVNEIRNEKVAKACTVPVPNVLGKHVISSENVPTAASACASYNCDGLVEI